MDKDSKVAFLYGYLYGKAEEIKSQGLFKDFTTMELVEHFIQVYDDGQSK